MAYVDKTSCEKTDTVRIDKGLLSPDPFDDGVAAKLCDCVTEANGHGVGVDAPAEVLQIKLEHVGGKTCQRPLSYHDKQSFAVEWV